MALAYVVVFGVIPVVAGYMVGQARGRTFQGVVLPLFLSYLGLVIVAILPPTAAKQAERDRQLAGAIAQRSTPARALGEATASPFAAQEEMQRALRAKRRSATAEALSRDPSLGEDTDPATLERLRVAVDRILIEQQTLDDLNAVKAETERRQPSDGSPAPMQVHRPLFPDDVVPESRLDRRERRPPLTADMKVLLRDNPPPRREPGWYVDPLDGRRARQWNGSKWTGAYRDII